MYIDYILDPESLSLIEASRHSGRHAYLPNTSRLHNFLSLANIDNFLNAKEGQLHEFVRVHRGGEETVISSSTRFSSKLQKATIADAYRKGSTLLVSRLERSEPILGGICRELEARWGGKSTARAFTTIAANDGFSTHFDIEPAIIVQLEGSKHWKLYEQLIKYPLHVMNRDIRNDTSLSLVEELTLHPGDILFIPGGVPHSASCANEHSLHLAITVSAFTAADFINFLATGHSQDTEILRTPIYLDDERAIDIVAQGIRRFIEQLSDVDARRLTNNYVRSFNASRHDHNDHSIADISQVDSINGDTIVFRNAQNLVTYVEGADKVLVYPSGTVAEGKSLIPKAAHLSLPLSVAQELRHLNAMEDGVRVRDIPGQLDESSKVLLVRELIRHRILTLRCNKQRTSLTHPTQTDNQNNEI